MSWSLQSWLSTSECGSEHLTAGEECVASNIVSFRTSAIAYFTEAMVAPRAPGAKERRCLLPCALAKMTRTHARRHPHPTRSRKGPPRYYVQECPIVAKHRVIFLATDQTRVSDGAHTSHNVITPVP